MSGESPLVHVVAGSLAGLISDAVVHPLDTVRARLQVDVTNAMHRPLTRFGLRTFAHVGEIFRKEGFRALYGGFTSVCTAHMNTQCAIDLRVTLDRLRSGQFQRMRFILPATRWRRKTFNLPSQSRKKAH
jgi:hypothetical protein